MKTTWIGCTLVLGLMLLWNSSCQSLPSITWRQSHGGIKYSIDRDIRANRIEKGKDGSLMYDSPELTVVCEAGKLTINGIPAGDVKKGDHVEITDLGTVLVNGQRRGDVMTGYHQNKKRIQQASHEVPESK